VHCKDGKFREVSLSLNIRHASKSLTDIYVFSHCQEAIVHARNLFLNPLLVIVLISLEKYNFSKANKKSIG